MDHADSFHANLSNDDVVNHPRANLPLVFSPPRRVHSNVENAEVEAEAEHGEVQAKAEHGKGQEDIVAPIPIQVVYPDVDADDDVKQFEFVRRASSQTDVGNQRGEEQADDVQEDDAGGNTRMRRSARQDHFNYAMEAEDVPSDTDDED